MSQKQKNKTRKNNRRPDPVAAKNDAAKNGAAKNRGDDLSSNARSNNGKNQDDGQASKTESQEKSPVGDPYANRRIVIYISCLAVVLIFMGGYWLYVSSKLSTLAEECEAAKTRGDWATLELKAREWATWDQDNDRPWMYAAAAAQEVGDEPRELAYLKNLTDTAPFAALLRRGHLLFRSNQIHDAISAYQHLTEREPNLKEAHRRLNFLYAMTRQRNAMISESRRAISTGADVPESYVFLVGADWITFTNGYQVNMQWADQYPDNSEIFEVASALHLISSGVDQSMETQHEDVKVALARSGDLISKLRVKYPMNREIVIMELAYNVHRANARRVGEILNGLEFSVEEDSRFHRVIGWFYSYREDWKEAEQAYLKCLELNPFDWQCRFEYATVLRNLKRTEELKAMQESAAMGKEIMRRVLQAENTADIPKSTLTMIVEYAKNCGETEVAQKLVDRLNGVGG